MADAERKPKQLKIPKGDVEEKNTLANGGTGIAGIALSKSIKLKKEEKTASESFDNGKMVKKNIKTNTVVKKDVVENNSNQDGKSSQKQKKVYQLPGQKHDPPAERDPLRIFYESLYEQVPTSEMASFWMMERGLLPEEVAREVYEKKMRKSGQKVGTPVKAVAVKKSVKTVEKKTISSRTEPRRKEPKNVKADSSDSDDDFIMSRVVKKAKTG